MNKDGLGECKEIGVEYRRHPATEAAESVKSGFCTHDKPLTTDSVLFWGESNEAYIPAVV